MSDFELRDEPYDGPSATALTAAVQLEYVERYGGPDDTPVEASEFAPPTGVFVVGYLDDRPVAMGGLRRHDDGVVEIKRMYVVPDTRGRGLSRVMLAGLEERAQQLGASRLILETGLKQPEAMRLYETSGYQPIEPYGHYRCAPSSRCYAKQLS
ncbi:MAG TPA: GNAT family N-acetyltransferase [Mycobacteriales bacterium]|nr:GNAT family N-acetyltransferase [Mycobacteriales bacterium]